MEVLTTQYYVRYKGEYFRRTSSALPIDTSFRWERWDSGKESFGDKIHDEERIEELESAFKEKYESVHD